MRYVQPKIIRTVAATRAIQSRKGGNESEAITHVLTSGPAYQSDE
jgi:hypothetical protein